VKILRRAGPAKYREDQEHDNERTVRRQGNGDHPRQPLHIARAIDEHAGDGLHH
jgi:hypothetical protein